MVAEANCILLPRIVRSFGGNISVRQCLRLSFATWSAVRLTVKVNLLLLISREPRSDFAYWPGRRVLAPLDALA